MYTSVYKNGVKLKEAPQILLSDASLCYFLLSLFSTI